MIAYRQTMKTWDDVQRFCAQQIAENTTLDYKQSIPNDLERTVAAMANTLGGTIIVGASEDAQARPQLPAAGMEFRRGFVEQVMSKCVDNIAPPIIPDIHECLDEANERCFIIIYVPQSREAPHAIASNTKVYIRTGRRNDPDELASLDRIAWISERRGKAQEFGEWLFARAATRFDLLRGGGVPGISASKDPENDRCLLTLAISPVYPDPSPLVRAPELEALCRQIVVPDPMGTSNEFPIKGEAPTRSVEDGIIIHVPGGQGLRTYHTHLNIHGLYFYKQSMLWHPPLRHGVTTAHPPAMRMSEIADRAYCLFASAIKFYDLVEYQGPLSVRLKLENFQGTALLVSNLAQSNGEYYLRFSADPLIEAVTFSATHTLITERNDVALHLIQRVAWAFDWDVDKPMLEKYSSSRFPGLAIE